MKFEIIENAINPALLRAAEASWPEISWSGWHRYEGKTADKYGSLHHSLIPRACAEALNALAESVSTRIGDSFIDYDMHAAGMHMLPPSGYLTRHIDAERHPIKPWRRTHSIVLFVNTIAEEFGGALTIGEDHIQPKFNTCVVFETADQLHEVLPLAEAAPYRKTLALFAWTHDESPGRSSANFSNMMQ